MSANKTTDNAVLLFWLTSLYGVFFCQPQPWIDQPELKNVVQTVLSLAFWLIMIYHRVQYKGWCGSVEASTSGITEEGWNQLPLGSICLLWAWPTVSLATGYTELCSYTAARQTQMLCSVCSSVCLLVNTHTDNMHTLLGVHKSICQRECRRWWGRKICCLSQKNTDDNEYVCIVLSSMKWWTMRNKYE